MELRQSALIHSRWLWQGTAGPRPPDTLGGLMRFHSTRDRGSMNYDPAPLKRTAAQAASRPTAPSSVQFSLSDLLCGIGLCAVGITVLMYASRAWLMVVASVTFLAFLVELLVAIYQPGARRAFAIGFITWGLIYLAPLDCCCMTSTRRTVYCQPATFCNSFTGSGIHRPARTPSLMFFPILAESERQVFFRTGQLMCTWVLAVCGGFAARELQRGNFDLRKLSRFRYPIQPK